MPTPLLPRGASQGYNATLLGALLTWFDNSDYLSTAFPSGLWLAEMPEELTFPLIVVDHLGEVPEWNTEPTVAETTSVQFKIFQVGAAAVETLALLVKNRFDWANDNLLIQGSHGVIVERKRFQIQQTDVRNQNAQVVHVGLLDYDIMISRPYTSEF